MPTPNDSTYKVVIAVVGFIVTLLICSITVFQTFHVPLVKADQEEKSERIENDKKICEQQDKDRMAVYSAISDIRVMMAEQRTDIAYIKREVSK